ncbi:MAG: hypothetical protein KDD82_07395 [Planctomycetes bacterium]|nr:hypothetical protein [Planctomycetota bacterium]
MPDSSPDELNAERARLARAAPDLLARIERIVDATPLFYATSAALRGGALPGGGCAIPLGAAVQLWDAGAWRAPCHACGALGFVLSYAGSCLSGGYSWTGVCARAGCAGAFTKASRSLVELHGPAQEVLGRRDPTRAWRRVAVRGEQGPGAGSAPLSALLGALLAEAAGQGSSLHCG